MEAKARRAASAFSAPETAKTISRALVRAGMVRVTRSTKGSSPGSAGSTRLAFVQGRCIREQGGDVTVRSDAEELEVEHGVAELALVVCGGLLLPELTL